MKKVNIEKPLCFTETQWELYQTELSAVKNGKVLDICFDCTVEYQSFHNVAKLMQSFTSIEFTTEDIVRSSLVKDFLIAVEKYEQAMREDPLKAISR